MRKFKHLAVAFGAGVLVLFFQNCAQQKGLDESADVTSQVVVKARLDDSEATPVLDPFEVRDEKALYVDFGRLRLELESGSILSHQDLAHPIAHLTPDEHQALKDLFMGSVIVRGDVLDPKPDQVCVMLYVEPYAVLATEAASYDMGSGSKCAPLDLYKLESKSRSGLKQFLTALQSRLADQL